MVFESEYTESASCLVSEDNGGDGDGEFFYPGGRSPDKETLKKVNGGYLWMGCRLFYQLSLEITFLSSFKSWILLNKWSAC